MNLYIRPFLTEFSGTTHSIIGVAVSGVLLLLAVILISLCIGRYAAHRWNGSKGKTVTVFILISSAVAVALFCFFGLSAKTFQGIIFSHILLISSYSDIKTRECDDCFSVMLLITAFIGIEMKVLPSMFVAAMLTAGMFLLVALTFTDGIGGADIKLSTTSVFLLGFKRGIIGLVLGLLFAVIINAIKSRKSGFPMIPYLTAAFIPAFFL